MFLFRSFFFFFSFGGGGRWLHPLSSPESFETPIRAHSRGLARTQSWARADMACAESLEESNSVRPIPLFTKIFSCLPGLTSFVPSRRSQQKVPSWSWQTSPSFSSRSKIFYRFRASRGSQIFKKTETRTKACNSSDSAQHSVFAAPFSECF